MDKSMRRYLHQRRAHFSLLIFFSYEYIFLMIYRSERRHAYSEPRGRVMKHLLVLTNQIVKIAEKSTTEVMMQLLVLTNQIVEIAEKIDNRGNDAVTRIDQSNG